MLKTFLKYLVRVSPVALTKNEYYDRLTRRIIQAHCTATDACIDVGAHDGKILQLLVQHCNKATHFAFEPLPHLYKLLVRKFGSACHVFPFAAGREKTEAPFSFVTAAPALSGLQNRVLPSAKKIEQLVVKVDVLDDCIPAAQTIRLIKLDIEGGEFDALLGAKRIMQESKPLLLFEFGKGGADYYNVTPKMMYDLLEQRGYSPYLLKDFLNHSSPLSLQQFEGHYTSNREYFFVAAPFS